jgi:xanthine dehydrogenase YagR molybdenum-binding subunit
MRALEVMFIDEQDPHVAEIALVGVAPAIANAVYHASGRGRRPLQGIRAAHYC